MVEHVVLLSATEGAEDELTEALARFVKEIVSLESIVTAASGPNFNTAAADRGWTHAMTVRLRGPEDLPPYWEHPLHVHLADTLERTCRDRFAIDYLVNEGVL